MLTQMYAQIFTSLFKFTQKLYLYFFFLKVRTAVLPLVRHLYILHIIEDVFSIKTQIKGN